MLVFISLCKEFEHQAFANPILKAELFLRQTLPFTIFFSNFSRNAVARQIAGELHSVTWVVSHFFCCAKRLHEVKLSSTFCNGLHQLATPLHSVSPLQQLVSQFYGSFNKDACAHFFFFVPKSIARQVAEKIAQ